MKIMPPNAGAPQEITSSIPPADTRHSAQLERR